MSGNERGGSPCAPDIREARSGSFVFEVREALDPAICADIIERFERDAEAHYDGRVGQTSSLDREVKRSTDLSLSARPQWRDVDRALFASLSRALTAFREGFSFFKGRFKDLGYAIQRTRPGEYYHWHIDGGSHEFSQRQLVALWYLNDVPGPGGETEFLYQRLRIRPETGKLLLFPPFWTHEHRGVRLEAGVKYVATTWIVFA